MLPLIIPILLIVGILAQPAPPPLATPMELAAWSECEMPMIAYYIGQRVEYAPQTAWLPAEAVMAAGRGDCKGKAVVARDALLACGYDTARITVIRTGRGYATKRHAIVFFTDPTTGHRGYIDDTEYKTFPGSTPWREILASEKRWKHYVMEGQ